MKFLGILLCRLGFHKGRLVHRENNTPVVWAAIGEDYRYECTRCKARTAAFTMTREELPFPGS